MRKPVTYIVLVFSMVHLSLVMPAWPCIDRQTLPVSSPWPSSDQQHSIFQLPFGTKTRATLAPSQFQQRCAVRVQAMVEMSTYAPDVMKVYDHDVRGFYISPEIKVWLCILHHSETDQSAYRCTFCNCFATNKGEVWVIRSMDWITGASGQNLALLMGNLFFKCYT